MKFRMTVLLSLLVSANTLMALEALPLVAPYPKDNPTTDERVELGKKLFFDPRISSTGTVSCNSCHNVMEGGDDGRTTSMGVDGLTGPRNAPTVWNSAFHSTQFWDGRAASLEEQAKGPMLAGVEMGMPNHQAVIDRITLIPQYQQEFVTVFGESGLNIDNAVKAIAAYERTLITPNSPFDKYAKGDKRAMNQQQLAGMELFTSIGCTACHSGPAFNGPQINLAEGDGFFQKFPLVSIPDLENAFELSKDLGRFNVTGKEMDKNSFRVPTLLNIELTAPYFHNGKVSDLKTAIDIMAKTQLNKELTDNQLEQLEAFMYALTGEFPQQTLPRLPSMRGSSVVPASSAGN